jgi:hypothetical protein
MPVNPIYLPVSISMIFLLVREVLPYTFCREDLIAAQQDVTILGVERIIMKRS